ncbi:acyltransferase family protein [Dactylosporangium sp. NPDC051541]|uniref:acyltransferase family protein n=1 Tax=Dactylosporangium sp. NPDC051541 TaxID=3363977 RepID=UPI0037B4B1BA
MTEEQVVGPGRAVPVSKPRVFRPDVQGLRAVAVLPVIADHLLRQPSGGFVGVDVFFVISGYLITSLLLREHDRTGTISFRGFYVRRIKRIIPASVLVLASTVVAGYFLLDAVRFGQMVRDVRASVLFVANWRFAREGTDYFQEGLPPSPVQHFWSLAVEEQYYVVWPWLMLGILLVGVRRLAWGPRTRRLVIGATIGAITVGSFGWAMWETHAAPTVAYFSTFSRAWELGVGALVAVLGGALAIRSVAVRTVLGWLGLAGIVVSLFVVPAAPGFPAPWAALPVLATALVIAAGAGGDQPYLWPLTNPVSRYIGDVSYSLYLWHFPVVVLLAALMPSDSLSYYLIAAVVIAALSVASYHGVEDPLRKATWGRRTAAPAPARPAAHRAPRPHRFAVLRPGAIAVGLLLVVAVGAAAPVWNATPADAKPPAGADRCLGAAVRDASLGCPKVQGNFVLPAPADLTKDTAGAFDCWIAEKSPMRTCSYGEAGTGTLSVALLGDSHAAMLLPGLRTQLPALRWKLDSYVGWGCQWIRSGTGSSCDAAMRDIQQRLVSGPRYDIVIVTAARQKTAKDKAWVSRMYAEAWKPVAARGTKIVVVLDNPGVTDAALQCVRRVNFSVRGNDCGTPVSRAYAETDALVAAAAQVPGAAVVDLRPFFCDAKVCPAVIGNVIAYRDTVGHITGTFSRTLGPYVAKAVHDAAAG